MNSETAVTVPSSDVDIARLDCLQQFIRCERLHALRHISGSSPTERVSYHATGEEHQRETVHDAHNSRDRHDQRPVDDPYEAAEYAEPLEGPQQVGDGQAQCLQHRQVLHVDERVYDDLLELRLLLFAREVDEHQTG